MTTERTPPTCQCGQPATTEQYTGTTHHADGSHTRRTEPSCLRCAIEWQREVDWSVAQ